MAGTLNIFRFWR